MKKSQNKNNSVYKLNDGHLVSNDGLEKNNYFNLVINDKENSNYCNEEKRIEYIQLCINFDNYFATLASILKFSVETEGLENSHLGEVLEDVEKDLLYLQENYTIVERKDEKK